METKPFKLVAVATANKLARIVFALMRDEAHYVGTPAYQQKRLRPRTGIEGDSDVMGRDEDRCRKPAA